jgi:hypothetical protein
MHSRDLILRSRAKRGVSKDGNTAVRLGPSFETPASRAPQDEGPRVTALSNDTSGRGTR